MSEHQVCKYCQLINNGGPDVCDNYPNKGWCPVGWKPEDLETTPSEESPPIVAGDPSGADAEPQTEVV